MLRGFLRRGMRGCLGIRGTDEGDQSECDDYDRNEVFVSVAPV